MADIFRRHGGAFCATQGNRPRTDHARPGYPRPAPHRRRLRRQAIGAHLAVQASTIVDRHINHGAPPKSSLSSSEGAQPLLRPLHLVVRETEFCGLRLAGFSGAGCGRTVGIRFADHAAPSLTRKNYGGFCLPGNRPGLSGRRGCNHISFATGANPSARVRSRRRNVAQSVGSVCGSKSMRLRPCLRSDFR